MFPYAKIYKEFSFSKRVGRQVQDLLFMCVSIATGSTILTTYLVLMTYRLYREYF